MLYNWSVIRGLRIVIGFIVLVQSILQQDITFGIIAGFLLVTAIVNVSCCSINGCVVNINKIKKANEVLHEESDTRK